MKSHKPVTQEFLGFKEVVDVGFVVVFAGVTKAFGIERGLVGFVFLVHDLVVKSLTNIVSGISGLM